MVINGSVGAFAFRNEGDGCLTAKYHHHSSNKGPFIEGCKLRQKTGRKYDGFSGVYHTIWLEENEDFWNSELEISKNKSNPSLFDLKWYDLKKGSSPFAKGTAMLVGDLLVGAYWYI